jgi:hypothetical protein
LSYFQAQGVQNAKARYKHIILFARFLSKRFFCLPEAPNQKKTAVLIAAAGKNGGILKLF